MHRLLLLPFAAVVLLLACGTGSETSEGTLQLSATIAPDPPVAGRNTLTIEVRDAQGQPVEGASLEVKPWMPSHGHGSTETPVVSALGEGRYRATPVTFSMPGQWEVTILATSGTDKGEKKLSWNVK
jgi:nitrogen fixation protein FixH